MKHNPDDRSDNVEKIQFNINHTIRNMELAEEMIEITDDPKMKKALEEKNERRREALNSMRAEIRDEALDRERGYE
ncbi:MAG TPA: small acid-soluble spore protein Tlp [Syntrophomonadaceae bacterium]|jgi:small acid-soluble spore protein (thioredoxin-like protein)|nr:small acid-soluble spore protein Tlp [Syntrophomonadaceae bacterium]HOQ09391.1 small acid-soluble spore protein Tlp [Syntrophomonadaceae bacterium]HPU48339.1 small acid-soluble spore protein Tlp [Syntrophomonadaceae bacterium]